MKQLDEGPLPQRLAALSLPMPATLVPRVLARMPSRTLTRRPIWASVALAACVLLAGLISATYFAPRFGQALADSPVVGPAIDRFLAGAGLGPIAGRFAPVGTSATSSGYRLQLQAAYADSNEVYLVIRSTPALFAFPDDLSLTDQFGRTLELKGGQSEADGSDLVVFKGVGWPDDVVGARLTLHVRSLERSTESGGRIGGDWRLSAVVDVAAARPYPHPLPAAGRLGDSTVEFRQVIASAATVRVDMKVTGPLTRHITDIVGQEVPGVSKPRPAFQIRLLGADGREVQELDGGASSGVSGTDVTQTWLRPARGNYRLVVSFEGVGEIERQLSLDY
jgi:hypothetical protein